MVQRCRVGVSSLDPCFPDAWGKRSRLAPLQARRAAASASNGARRRLDLGLGTPSQVPLAHLTGRSVMSIAICAGTGRGTESWPRLLSDVDRANGVYNATDVY